MSDPGPTTDGQFARTGRGVGRGLLPEAFARWLARLLRAALAAVFLYAGLVKAGASESFALALAPFTFLPPAWTGPLAVGIAVTEILAGVLLLVPRVHRAGSALVLALCVMFTGVLAWALANGIVVSCGCFGGDEPPSVRAMAAAIVRDIVLAAAAAFCLLHRDPAKAPRETSPRNG